MNGKIAKGPRRTTRRPAAGSRSQAWATAPVRPFCAVRRSSTRATHSSVPTRDRSAGSSGSGVAAGRSPSSRGGPPPSELMSQPLGHEGGGGLGGGRAPRPGDRGPACGGGGGGKNGGGEGGGPPEVGGGGGGGEKGFPPGGSEPKASDVHTF